MSVKGEKERGGGVGQEKESEEGKGKGKGKGSGARCGEWKKSRKNNKEKKKRKEKNENAPSHFLASASRARLFFMNFCPAKQATVADSTPPRAKTAFFPVLIFLVFLERSSSQK